MSEAASRIEIPGFDTVIALCAGDGTRNYELGSLGPNTLNEVGGTTTYGILGRQFGELGLGMRRMVTVVSTELTAAGIPPRQHIEGYINGRPGVVEKLRAEAKPNQAKIAGALPHRYGMEYDFVQQNWREFQGKYMYGTGLALGAALDIFEDSGSEYVAVVNGDGFDDEGEQHVRDAAIKVHESGASLGVLTTRIKRQYEGNYPGGIAIRNEHDEITKFNENPAYDEVPGTDDPEYNAGIYIVRRDMIGIARRYLAIDADNFGKPGYPGVEGQGEHRITDLFEVAHKAGKGIVSLVIAQKLADCSTYPYRRENDHRAAAVVAHYDAIAASRAA